MKLATIESQTNDGQLIIVDSKLNKALLADKSIPNLQYALDNWASTFPILNEAYERLCSGNKDAFDFNPKAVLAPLPRAYQWLDGSAYLPHVERVRKARGAEMPESFLTDPLMYQGGSDYMLSATHPIQVADESWGIDCEAEVAVVTDFVPKGINAQEALNHIKLIMIVNDVSLRNLIPSELAKGFGFLHSKPPTAFSPVAITPDELGNAWQQGKVHLPLITTLNQEKLGDPNAGVDMQFDFGELIAHAAKTRPLSAGTILGSGTISNQDTSKGCSCLAEKRVLEIIETGSATTPFLQYGDQVKIEMLDDDGQSIFGAIDQVVEAA